MSRFRPNEEHEIPGLNTASLPDLIFSILFFFMIVTSMREIKLKVKFREPSGTELVKLEHKSTVSYIYIGQPSDDMRPTMGSGTRIQLNDKYADPSEIVDYINSERDRMPIEDVHNMTVSIKADKNTDMETMSNVKFMLRRAHAFKINYSAVNK
jgi:biopolymer transport protein ExbD